MWAAYCCALAAWSALIARWVVQQKLLQTAALPEITRSVALKLWWPVLPLLGSMEL